MIHLYRFESFQVLIEADALDTPFAKDIILCAKTNAQDLRAHIGNLKEILAYPTTVLVNGKQRRWNSTLSEGQNLPFDIVRTEPLLRLNIFNKPETMKSVVEEGFEHQSYDIDKVYEGILSRVDNAYEDLAALKNLNPDFIDYELRCWIEKQSIEELTTLFKPGHLIRELFYREEHAKLTHLMREHDGTLLKLFCRDMEPFVYSSDTRYESLVEQLNSFSDKWGPVIGGLDSLKEIPIKLSGEKMLSIWGAGKERRIHLGRTEGFRFIYALLECPEIIQKSKLYVSLFDFLANAELSDNEDGRDRLDYFIGRDQNISHLWMNLLLENACGTTELLLRDNLLCPSDKILLNPEAGAQSELSYGNSAVMFENVSLDMFKISLRHMFLSSEVEIFKHGRIANLVQISTTVLPAMLLELKDGFDKKNDSKIKEVTLKIEHIIEIISKRRRSRLSESIVFEFEQSSHLLMATSGEFRKALLNLHDTLINLPLWSTIANNSERVQRQRANAIRSIGVSGSVKHATLLMSVYTRSNADSPVIFRDIVPPQLRAPLALDIAYNSIYSDSARLKRYADRLSPTHAMLNFCNEFAKVDSPETVLSPELIDMIVGLTQTTPARDTGSGDEFRFCASPPPIDFYHRARARVISESNRKYDGLMKSYAEIAEKREIKDDDAIEAALAKPFFQGRASR